MFLLKRFAKPNRLPSALKTTLTTKYSTVAPSSAYLDRLEIQQTDNGLYALTYDGRRCKAPIPFNHLELVSHSKVLLAMLLAEWRNLITTLKEKPLPMSSLFYRALELQESAEKRMEAIKGTVIYLDTDTLCYWDEDPKTRQLQQEKWHPVIEKLCQAAEIPMPLITSSINPIRQASLIHEKCTNILVSMNGYQLAAIESLTANLKSHLLALALHYGIVENSSQAVDLSLLELQSQQDRWGSLEDAHSLSKASLSRHVHLGELMLLCSGRN